MLRNLGEIFITQEIGIRAGKNLRNYLLEEFYAGLGLESSKISDLPPMCYTLPT